MQRNVVTVAEDQPLGRALQLMLWNDARHLPVSGADGARVVGVISERDVLRAYQSSPGEDVLAREVRECMTAPPRHVHPDAPLADAAADLSVYKLGCLLVLDAGALVGLVAVEDVLAVVAQLPLRSTAPGGDDTVGAAMTTNPIVAFADDRVLMAAAKMVRSGVRHICVIDGEERVIGMLSDRDVRRAIGDPQHALDDDVPERMAELRVEAIMTPNPRTLAEAAPLRDALDALLGERFGALPVVDADDRLRGICSYVDVLRRLSERAVAEQGIPG
jgi:acetoin utilization protein AcuB